MKKILQKSTILLLIINMVLLLIIYDTQDKVFAASDSSISDEIIERAYDEGIKDGYIISTKVTIDQWKEQNVEYEQCYEDGIKEGVLPEGKDYIEWLKENCYGQGPKEELFEEVPITNSLMRSTVNGFTLKRGDILITNGTSSAGILGHAAICNGDNVVLDMAGAGLSSRQKSQSWWINHYKNNGSNRWVKVYRMKDYNLAKQAARWADRNYYSTTGSSTQNIFPTYSLSGSLYSKNPSYCSKLVFQAYYFGTGSTPVMTEPPSFRTIHPYDLINYFNSSYKPVCKHVY
ncbi:hypothetical protein KQI30_14895 [Clostridium bornimense]|uniref:hypothetical protein n=1 Tax=Clostridium bornimense TaxID=1216932 RepID=UPI001C10C4D1|nr:hypothetical protein [Clostridium bornimense]MBU5317541.1 hypothetical protein [Clostridium bornimense]